MKIIINMMTCLILLFSAGCVIAPNSPPTAINQSVTTIEDTSISIILQAIDNNDDELTFIVGIPSNGNLTGDAPHLIYTPNPDFVGIDHFTFTANDGRDDSNIGNITVIVLAKKAPAANVATFYYPWYGNPDVNGYWHHWEQCTPQAIFNPPYDISSDYYPLLGPYSSIDSEVVTQHFAWLQKAGIGIIVSSWWGQGSYEDQAIPILLEIGQLLNIKVAFHMEPYIGRTSEKLVEDIKYIYNHYGSHPAFYRTKSSSLYSQNDRSKGLFFLYASGYTDGNFDNEVNSEYWQEAIDTIHNLPDSGIIIADTLSSDWIQGGHFDGLYNYGDTNITPSSFSWVFELPSDTWYVPCVMPGYSTNRIGYPERSVPRNNGDTYDQQWEAALKYGFEPELVAITSFNEWHEGTQIEPAAEGLTNHDGYTYVAYGLLGPEGYIERTRQWVDKFLNWTYSNSNLLIRIKISTTSDWTTFKLVNGGNFIHPTLVSVDDEATFYLLYEENSFILTQALASAKVGERVEIVFDVYLMDFDSTGVLTVEIGRGHLGGTKVFFMNQQESVIKTFEWNGINYSVPENTLTIPIPVLEIIS